jgi:hypothetical protein
MKPPQYVLLLGHLPTLLANQGYKATTNTGFLEQGTIFPLPDTEQSLI